MSLRSGKVHLYDEEFDDGRAHREHGVQLGGSSDREQGREDLRHAGSGDVLMRVKDDLLGAEPESRLRNLFYRVDPFQSEQMVRAPKHFHTANIYCGLLYFTLIFLFAASAFYQFFTRPAIESYSMVPSHTAPPVPVHVSLSCTPGGWSCAACNGTLQPDLSCEGGNITFTTVQESYLNTRRGYCDNIASASTLHPNTSTIDHPTHLNLTACYSVDFDDGILISVPFSAGYAEESPPRMVVTLTSPDTDLFYQQHLEPAQRKSIFLGQTNYHSSIDDSDYTQS
mmetsp:Transcript_23799/g.40525  ORF Transcript_23799/g.40525 Transcript_23799/m.40525 type:complete len:283 (+) Transcript_23799:131-979(+)